MPRVTWLDHVLILLVALSPLTPLLQLQASFAHDWENHLSIIRFFGDFLREHGTFPEALSIPRACGMPFPLFYGVLFYPLLGAASLLLGAPVALRVACIIIMYTQARVLHHTVRQVSRARWTPLLVCALVLWTAYPWTNLYNRAAITEFFAQAFWTIFLTLGARWLLTSTSKAEARLLSWKAALALTLALGTHPPSAVIQAPLLLLFLGIWLLRRFNHQSSLAPRLTLTWMPFVLGILVLLPWFFVAATEQAELRVTRQAKPLSIVSTRYDSLGARLSPVPFDSACVETDIQQVSSPFLEAPINSVLAILCLGLVIARKLWGAPKLTTYQLSLLSLLGLLSAGALLLSLGTFAPQALMAVLGPSVQFGYRLVSLCNACLFLLTLLLWSPEAEDQRPHHFRSLLLILACTQGASLGIKLSHAKAISHPAPGPLPSLEAHFGGAALDYTQPAIYSPLKSSDEIMGDVAFKVGSKADNFALPQKTQFTAAKGGWYRSNALPFVWSSYADKGVRIPAERLRTRDFVVYLFLDTGTHELDIRWEAPRLFKAMRLISAFAALVMLTGFGFLVLQRSKPEEAST